MADYSVSATEVGVWGKPLAAGVADTVTFAGLPSRIRVWFDTGTTAVFFTVDGSAPVVGAQNCYRVLPTAGSWVEVERACRRGLSTVVRLITSTAATYSVEVRE